MKKRTLFLRGLAVSALAACLSCNLSDLFGDTVSIDDDAGLTEAEVISGLKEALGVGIDTAAVHLSAAGGYLLNEAIKILLPEDVKTALTYVEHLNDEIEPVTSTLSLLGVDIFNFSVFNGMRDSLMVSMNRAAEKAAPLSIAIFKDAITAMTIRDGFGILNGDSIAATAYLKNRTFDPLTGVFEPFVDSTLALVGAQVLWGKLSASYNDLASYYKGLPSSVFDLVNLPVLPFDTLSTDLALYTTQKALDGLFYTVGEQETLIRKDPVARVTEILRRVFGSPGMN
ncbi:MAG: DUF4197 domain-containing protein [Chitinispirillaceae bacterium]|nr:DUF4197 domain-containing protein [Chitinispirillaceae bacterium]